MPARVGPWVRRGHVRRTRHSRGRGDQTAVRGVIPSIVAVGSIATILALAGCSIRRTENPSAVPRTEDGRPDLNGIWQALTSASWDIQDHSARPGVPAGQGIVDGGELPYQGWAFEKKKSNFEKRD